MVAFEVGALLVVMSSLREMKLVAMEAELPLAHLLEPAIGGAHGMPWSVSVYDFS